MLGRSTARVRRRMDVSGVHSSLRSRFILIHSGLMIRLRGVVHPLITRCNASGDGGFTLQRFVAQAEQASRLALIYPSMWYSPSKLAI